MKTKEEKEEKKVSRVIDEDLIKRSTDFSHAFVFEEDKKLADTISENDKYFRRTIGHAK